MLQRRGRFSIEVPSPSPACIANLDILASKGEISSSFDTTHAEICISMTLTSLLLGVACLVFKLCRL